MSVDGSYKVVTKSAMGGGEGVFTLATEGETLKGTVEFMGETLELQNGTTSGNDFSATVEGKSPMGPMKLKFNGSVEGDAISGVLTTGLMKIKFSGERIS
jgi:hypothetical protein